MFSLLNVLCIRIKHSRIFKRKNVARSGQCFPKLMTFAIKLRELSRTSFLVTIEANT